MRTIHSSRIWRLRCLRSRVAYASACSRASRAGLISFDFVPLRPSAALSRRLWRLWEVTPRLTRAMSVSGLLEVRKQAADLLGLRRRHDGLAGVPAGPSRRLDLEVVAAPRLDPDVLAGAGHADPLLGRLVALHLRHDRLTLLFEPALQPAWVRFWSRRVPGPRSPRRPAWPLVSSSSPRRRSGPLPVLRRWPWPEPELPWCWPWLEPRPPVRSRPEPWPVLRSRLPPGPWPPRFPPLPRPGWPGRRRGPRRPRACGLARRGSWACGSMPS